MKENVSLEDKHLVLKMKLFAVIFIVLLWSGCFDRILGYA